MARPGPKKSRLGHVSDGRVLPRASSNCPCSHSRCPLRGPSRAPKSSTVSGAPTCRDPHPERWRNRRCRSPTSRLPFTLWGLPDPGRYSGSGSPKPFSCWDPARPGTSAGGSRQIKTTPKTLDVPGYWIGSAGAAGPTLGHVSDFWQPVRAAGPPLTGPKQRPCRYTLAFGLRPNLAPSALCSSRPYV